MARFDFTRGNAQKLLSLPLYAFGFLASLVIPRSSRRWVFGSGPGIGEGALELYRYVATERPDLSLRWLAKDRTDVAAAAALGIPAVVRTSPASLWRTLRSRVIVVTHGFGDVNRYGTRGAFVVQLWHGIPLKLIQLDSPATMTINVPGGWRLRGVLRRFYRRGFRAIRLLPASSDLVAERLRTAFGLSGQVVVTGDPRDDVLARTSAAQARAAVSEQSGPLILFAPTWRDGQVDPGIPTTADWDAIANYLEGTGSRLVIRPHPLGVGDYEAGPATSASIRLLGQDEAPEITPLLPAFDLLITDYSSIAFDFALTGGGIFFLAVDEEAYTTNRGLYEPYREFADGREVRSWAALLGQLVQFDSDGAFRKLVLAHTASLATTHFAFRDGGNTARVYDLVQRGLERRR